MKAILVIDLNDTTLKEWDTVISKCWAKVVVNTPIKGGAHGIGCVYAKNYVELKPMPQKKKVEVNEIKDIMHTEYSIEDIYKNKYVADIRLATDKLIALGYNYCIDEILGEKQFCDVVELERPLLKVVYEEIEKLFDDVLGEKYEHNCKKD